MSDPKKPQTTAKAFLDRVRPTAARVAKRLGVSFKAFVVSFGAFLASGAKFSRAAMARGRRFSRAMTVRGLKSSRAAMARGLKSLRVTIAKDFEFSRAAFSRQDYSFRRMRKLALIAVVCSSPVWAAGRFLIALNAKPPVIEANALRTALQTARGTGVRAYAPVDMAVADAAADRALTKYARAVTSATGFLRYDAVQKGLFEAHAQVVYASSKAKTRTDKAKGNAAGVIRDGRTGIQAAEDSLRNAPIGGAVRASLARARVAVGTAEARWRVGDYAEATRLALFAKSTTDDIRRRASNFLQTYTTSSAAQRWDRWVNDTIVTSRQSGSYAVVVDKLRHKCLLYRAGSLVRSYDVDLGGPLWDKMHSGDRATPEGMYRIVRKRPKGATIYYKALLINYPNEEDRVQFAMAKQRGWISRRAGIGGLIEIHGEGGRKEDWTLGCVALANRDIDELFQVVNVGTPVTIVGTINKSRQVSG